MFLLKISKYLIREQLEQHRRNKEIQKMWGQDTYM
jgi:hypothetical protein